MALLNEIGLPEIGWAIYLFVYYTCALMFYIFKAAIEHGGATAGAIVLVIFLVLGLSRVP